MSFPGNGSLDGPASGSRRRFVLGTVSSGALLALGRPRWSWAAISPQNGQQTLRGRHFELTIGYQEVNFTGAGRTATVINGSLPAPILRWQEGDRVSLRVTNKLAHDSSIHWHGVILPAGMDGVPGISFDGIKPGATFEYEFDVRQSGTYWYHSHSGFQEQTGLYGAVVIDPMEPEPFAYDRDYVVVLSDWSDEDPDRIFARLKKQSHYYNFNQRTVGDLWREIKAKGVTDTWSDRSMRNRMRMNDRDISDVTGYTYTFLMNGRTPAEGWTGLFARGEKIRLRFINASSMTFFDVRIPGLQMTVISADGQSVEPVSVDEFRIGAAETYDVIVEPAADTAYTVFAQAIDRSGFARGTLTPDISVQGEIPVMDPVPILTHADMGMAHDGDHVLHRGKTAHRIEPAMEHGAHDMGAMGEDMRDMDDTTGLRPRMGSGSAGYGSSAPIRRARTAYGPSVDMRAEHPRYRLDDPGAGLRDNGRRVLTYADLRNLYDTPDPREPGREIELHLTGNMRRFMWSIDGVASADAGPLDFRFGERLRVTLVNDTMMNHPMHQHGLWSDLETGDGERIPRKHTVIVQPGARISYLVTADNPGHWAFHCHLLYHMTGMFREVHVT